MTTQTFNPGLQVAVLLALVALSACDTPSAPSASAGSPAGALPAGHAAPMSDAAYDALSIDSQYRVANKLLATLFDGMPVEDFYSLEQGSALRARVEPTFTLSTIREALATELEPAQRARLDSDIVGDEAAIDSNGSPAPIEARFRFDGDRPKQMPLARMAHWPQSRDRFSQWMAWHLANTILFSPAEEIDSADITDVQNLFRRLDLQLMARTPLRAMIATHQRSVQNWRRFRSPEDNTREMMEIYLGLFDNDAEVPLASQACQDLYLTDERDGYKLAYTDFPNYEPVQVLGRTVMNCGDFYDAVASHPLVIPRVTAVLVDYFFAGFPLERRLGLTEAIAASQPVTFEDIFLAILFSEAYLLDVERPTSFEENFLAMAARLEWDAHPDMPRGLASGRGALARADMREMGWPTMSLKLGRVGNVPMDSLSFGNRHKALREGLMLDSIRWREPLALVPPGKLEPPPPSPLGEDPTQREQAAYDDEFAGYQSALELLSPDERAAHDLQLAVWQVDFAAYRRIDDLNIIELIDYLLLASVQRRASDVERNALFMAIVTDGHLDSELDYRFAKTGRQDDIARIVLDYASRLPETYYLTRLR